MKHRVTEVLYSWTQWLKDEPKVQEAYRMLKKQGERSSSRSLQAVCEFLKLISVSHIPHQFQNTEAHIHQTAFISHVHLLSSLN